MINMDNFSCECMCVEVTYMGVDGRDVYIFGGDSWKKGEGRLFHVIKKWTRQYGDSYEEA